MDNDERKIGMLIAVFDEEHDRLTQTISALGQVGAQLKIEVNSGARSAVADSLKSLTAELDRASQTLVDLQRLSLWRAAGQHAMVAFMAIVITLLAVWWYVPPLAEITARRTERDRLEASIEDLTKRGARIKLNTCGPQKQLCVLIDELAGRYGWSGNEVYRIPKGY